MSRRIALEGVGPKHPIEFLLDIGQNLNLDVIYRGWDFPEHRSDVFVGPVGHFTIGKLSNIDQEVLRYPPDNPRSYIPTITVAVNHISQSTEESRKGLNRRKTFKIVLQNWFMALIDTCFFEKIHDMPFQNQSYFSISYLKS